MAARVLGTGPACFGTRFIATREANAHPRFKPARVDRAPRESGDRTLAALIHSRQAGRVVRDQNRLSAIGRGTASRGFNDG